MFSGKLSLATFSSLLLMLASSDEFHQQINLKDSLTMSLSLSLCVSVCIMYISKPK
ncbi:hypothetical protein ACP275_12G164700 [Erythranthe tilingii]